MELVRVDVAVVDRRGLPVKDLTAADFEVTERGQIRPIVTFDAVEVKASPKSADDVWKASWGISEPLIHSPVENRCFLVFFDDVHVSAPPSQQVRVELARFLESEIHEGDWLTVVAPMSGLNWTARTREERQRIPKVLESLKGQLVRDPFHDGLTDYNAMNAVEYGRKPPGSTGSSAGNESTGNATRGVQPSLMGAPLKAEERYAVAQRRIHQTLSTLREALTSLIGLPGRKALVLYSEGFIKAPQMREYDEVIDIARRAHVSIYSVDPRGLRSGLEGADGDAATGNPLVELETEAGGTTYLAAATGGRASISNDLTRPFHEAIAESSAYYVLGLEPSPGRPGERRIKVRLLRDGLIVRAPDRYVVGEPQKTGKAQPDARALASLADTLDIPLKVTTLFLKPSLPKETPTTFAIEVGGGVTVGGERRLNLLIEARPLDRGNALRGSSELTLPAGAEPTTLTREIVLRPGLWQARLVVRDARTDKSGSVLHTFEVPGPGFRLSSPILTDKVDESGMHGGRVRLDRRYASSQTLYCEYEVFGAISTARGAGSRVTASYVILRDERTIQEVGATPIEPTADGRLLRLLELDLSRVEPGAYTLRLHVRNESTDQAIELSEPFVVVPSIGL